jgi:hypothetical protein
MALCVNIGIRNADGESVTSDKRKSKGKWKERKKNLLVVWSELHCVETRRERRRKRKKASSN